MEIDHNSNDRRSKRIRSNWCSVCKQSFSKSEYSVHIRTEHQHDSRKVHSMDSENYDIICNNNNISRNKDDKKGNNKSPSKSSKPLKKETQLVDQPSDIFKGKASPKKRGRPNVKSLLFTCNQCKFKSESQKGLKIHLSTRHKNNINHYKQKSSTNKAEAECVQPVEVKKEDASDCENSTMYSSNNQSNVLHNIPTNLSQNIQSGFINNFLPNQTYPMNNGSVFQLSNFRQSTEEHPNLQFVPIVLNQNSPVEIVPKLEDVQPEQVKPYETSAQCKNSAIYCSNNQPIALHNIPTNLSQNTQTGFINNPLPIQTYPMNNGSVFQLSNFRQSTEGHPNVQFLPIVLNQNSPAEIIPKLEDVQPEQVKPYETSAQCKNSAIYCNNNQPIVLPNIPTNLCQNTQTGFINNPLPIQTYPMNNNIGSEHQGSNFQQSTENHTNTQFLPTFLDQNPVETIPKFDYESKYYVKWLKKFIYKCKSHKYPLTPALCKRVSFVFQEISTALDTPSGALEGKTNHFYFNKFRDMLAEIMMGQVRYSMDVVKRNTLPLTSICSNQNLPVSKKSSGI